MIIYFLPADAPVLLLFGSKCLSEVFESVEEKIRQQEWQVGVVVRWSCNQRVTEFGPKTVFFFFVYLVESLLEDTERLPAHTAESSDINKKQGKAINITKLGIHIKDDPKSIIEAH